MLRRPPTSITITADDIDAYDQLRLRRHQQQKQEQQAATAAATANTQSATNTSSFNSSVSTHSGPAGDAEAIRNLNKNADRNGDVGAPGIVNGGMRPYAAQERERARERAGRIMGAEASGANVIGTSGARDIGAGGRA